MQTEENTIQYAKPTPADVHNVLVKNDYEKMREWVEQQTWYRKNRVGVTEAGIREYERLTGKKYDTHS